MNASDYTGPKRRYAACWPRVMQMARIVGPQIRNSDKYPAVDRLADLPGAGGLVLCSERPGAGRDRPVGLLLLRRPEPCE